VGTPYQRNKAVYAFGQYYLEAYGKSYYTSADLDSYTENYPAGLGTQGVLEYLDNDGFSNWSTIDFWYRPDVNQDPIFIGHNISNNSGWRFLAYSGVQQMAFYGSPSRTLSSNTVLAANTWHHFRIAKSGTTVSMYVNGTRTATRSDVTSITNPSVNLQLFAGVADSATDDVYIDELFITNDLLTDPSATSFAVPTTEFTNTANTRLLAHYNLDFADDAFQANRTQSAVAQLNSAFTQTAQGGLISATAAQLNTAATATVSAQVTAAGTATVSAEFTTTATATRIYTLSAQFDTVASQISVVAKVGDTLVSVNVLASLTAAAQVIRNTQSQLASEFNQTTANTRTRDVSAALTTSAS
jgi:hypothetical protein